MAQRERQGPALKAHRLKLSKGAHLQQPGLVFMLWLFPAFLGNNATTSRYAERMAGYIKNKKVVAKS
jgi:hypothetical protein